VAVATHIVRRHRAAPAAAAATTTTAAATGEEGRHGLAGLLEQSGEERRDFAVALLRRLAGHEEGGGEAGVPRAAGAADAVNV
jgi:hypothetical protein